MPSTITKTSLGNKPFASPFFSIGREILQNMYLEVAQSSEAKSDFYLLKIAGLKRLSPIMATSWGACRGLITTGGYRTFGVWGFTFGEVLSNGSIVEIGRINSGDGVVQMAENGYQLIVVDGLNGWIYSYSDTTTGTASWTQITDEYFPGNAVGSVAPTHVCYIDTYFVVNVPNTNEYLYSESYYMRAHDNTTTDYDPTKPNGYWNPIRSGKKIGKADNISALANVNNQIWLFGFNSNEVHYDTGDLNNQLFARYEGAILNYGCRASNSVATYANNVFWLGSDTSGTLGVFTNDGMVPKRISTRGIEQIIQEFEKYTDCIGFTYAQAGHAFYVMQFPKASRTFVYDLVTDAWHERTFLDQSTGGLYAWRGMFCTSNFDKLITGDRAWSGVYEQTTSYYQNDNIYDTGINYIRCVKNTPILFSLGKNVRFDWAQVICNQGQGLEVDNADGVGAEPTVQLAYSNDTGISYKNERSAPLGKIGEYRKRSMFLGLGMGRNRVFRITMTDPVPFILVALDICGQECAF